MCMNNVLFNINVTLCIFQHDSSIKPKQRGEEPNTSELSQQSENLIGHSGHMAGGPDPLTQMTSYTAACCMHYFKSCTCCILYNRV